MKQAVVGMGISFLPEHCVKQELENGELFRVEMTPPVKINISIDFIYLKSKPKSVFIYFYKIKCLNKNKLGYIDSINLFWDTVQSPSS
ncbi:hypothetical protein [Bacillus cereus]|uniref:hypothetical protein n=1 Tax=Bacillus cereus TaxID=1396 RepID=UPI0020B7EA8C|nr:hypothetical protein [Bacillus cereus]